MANSQSHEQKIKQNYLLASLPADVFERLYPQMRVCQLEKSKSIYRPEELVTTLYFPTSALLSWMAVTYAGERVEVGLAGKEGVVGVGSLLKEKNLPFEIEAEHPGEAVAINTDIFQVEFDQSPVVQTLFIQYIHTNLIQLAQSAACNRFHSAESRLCRWLLTASDRLQTDTLSLTQDTIAGMIGAGRPTVTLVVGTLQTAGLIRAKRGEITLLDREGLETVACECYGVIKQSLDQFLFSVALEQDQIRL